MAPEEDENAYEKAAGQPLAQALTVPPLDQPKGKDAYLRFGEALWAVARQALSHWTPERMELEALRRANDSPVASLVAREAWLMMEKYQSWAARLVDIEVAFGDRISAGFSPIVFRGGVVRERVVEAIGALERRATSVETRALDLRLRYEHERLRAELRKQELTSTLLEAMHAATRNPESEEHLKNIAAKLDGLHAVEKRLGSIEGEVVFVADSVMDEFARREMKPPAVKTLRRLGEMVSSGAAKGVVAYVIKKFFGG